MGLTYPSFKPCPCGSKRSHHACCGPFVTGTKPAPTAETLMRSRYTAYVLKREAYLLATWHPSTRPASLDLAQDTTRWEGLQVHQTTLGQSGDQQGTVEFTARYVAQGTRHRMHEVSRFVKEQDLWFYLDGVVEA